MRTYSPPKRISNELDILITEIKNNQKCNYTDASRLLVHGVKRLELDTGADIKNIKPDASITYKYKLIKIK